MPAKKSLIHQPLVGTDRKSSIVKQEKTERKTINDKRQTIFTVPVYSLAGEVTGSMELPKEIFGQKVNQRLLSQTARVYLTNKKTLLGSTKTRGQVIGSKAKIYAQKGTGRARHGAITAPIFVGGGITFGPKPRRVRLSMPKKMKKAALYQALSSKALEKKIFGLSALEKATGKTREFVAFLNKILKESKDRSTLVVTESKLDNVLRGVRNIAGMNTLPVNLINAYEVLNHDFLMITKGAVSKLESRVENLESSKKTEGETTSH